MTPNSLIYDDEVTESIYYSDWREFVNKFESFPKEQKMILFRGQSNFINNENTNKWKPYGFKTSLQRNYDGADPDDFINTLDYFIKHKSKYRALSKLDFTNTEDYLSLVLYLRHAGIPMPVLDLTFDALTALFFAVHDIVVAYGVISGKIGDDPRYVSVYEFDKSILVQHYGAKEIGELKFMQRGITDSIFFVTEIEKLSHQNNNMLKQNGAFIFLSSSYSLEVLINAKNKRQYEATFLELPKAIRHHKIFYKALLPKFGDRDNVFRYLAAQGKTGFSLFEDEQALLYDFKNPYFLNVL